MPRNKTAQCGNAFFFVLLGIVLFAALAITITRGMRGNTTARMTARQVEITVSDILTYMQRAERAVDRVRRHSCSENDISFENGMVTGYDHTPAAPAKCRVFDPAGGGLSWKASSLDNLQFEYWGSDAVQDVGSAANEIVMALQLPQNAYREVCEVINKKMGISGIPGGTSDESSTLFNGTFGVSTISITETPGKLTGCFDASGAGDFIIYSVLLAR